MQLREELATLRLRDLKFRRAFAKRTKRVEALKVRSAECGVRSVGFFFHQTDGGNLFLRCGGLKFTPRHEERIAIRNQLRVFLGDDSKLFRLAEEKNGFFRQMIQQRRKRDDFRLKT